MSNYDYHPDDESRLEKGADSPPKENPPSKESPAQDSDAFWHSSRRHDGTGPEWDATYAETREKSGEAALSQIDDPPLL